MQNLHFAPTYYKINKKKEKIGFFKFLNNKSKQKTLLTQVNNKTKVNISICSTLINQHKENKLNQKNSLSALANIFQKNTAHIKVHKKINKKEKIKLSKIAQYTLLTCLVLLSTYPAYIPKNENTALKNAHKTQILFHEKLNNKQSTSSLKLIKKWPFKIEKIDQKNNKINIITIITETQKKALKNHLENIEKNRIYKIKTLTIKSNQKKTEVKLCLEKIIN
eukprot:COSAG01_NODE_69_length_28801_cov_10.460038_26_plen_222_part_00